MTEAVDFHVGLLKGFILAQNPPTQILHALDVLLAGYRSKAGAVIGQERQEIAPLERALKVASQPAGERVTFSHTPDKSSLEDSESTSPAAPDVKVTKTKHFWDKEDDAIVYQNYVVEGKFPAHLHTLLPHRTKGSIVARIAQKGWKRGQK